MKDTVMTFLNTRPEVGIATTVGSWGAYYAELLNPTLSLISLTIGCIIGFLTLITKYKQWRHK